MKLSLHHRNPRWRRFSSKSKTLVVLAVVSLVLWPVSWAAAKWLIRTEPIARADVIVVMAGSGTFKERTQKASELYKQGRAPKIVVTNDNHQGGWAADEQRNIPYQELAARWLRRQGVPDAAIETLPQPVNGTHEEAMLLHEYARSQRLRSVLVVTSAYHSRRTLWTLHRVFADAGIVIGLEVAPTGFQSPPPATWWLRGRGWQMIPAEYVKLVYYHLAY